MEQGGCDCRRASPPGASRGSASARGEARQASTCVIAAGREESRQGRERFAGGEERRRRQLGGEGDSDLLIRSAETCGPTDPARRSFAYRRCEHRQPSTPAAEAAQAAEAAAELAEGAAEAEAADAAQVAEPEVRQQ